MAKLKSRDKFTPLPGGFPFLQAETGWSAPSGSFESVVQAIISHRRGNPHLMTVHGWSIDPETVRNELDSYCARFCKQLGYTDYILEGAPEPPPNPTTPVPIHQRLGNVVDGGETVVEWLSSGAEAVPSELSNKRAEICSTCPQNGKGDFTRYFTVPVSEAIRHRLNQRSEMKLSTPHDDQLNVCEACNCPLRLKVHFPMDRILRGMDPETKTRLDPRCWILKQDQI